MHKNQSGVGFKVAFSSSGYRRALSIAVGLRETGFGNLGGQDSLLPFKAGL